MTKTCGKCKEIKNESEFYLQYGKPRSICKNCMKAANYERQKKIKYWKIRPINKEKQRAYMKKYCAKNPEKIKANNRRFREKNPEYAKLYARDKKHGTLKRRESQ